MLHLVRLAREDGWSASAAAARMVEIVGGDRSVLRRLRAQLLLPAGRREGMFAVRALATIEAALVTVER
ncbi:MAG TPA: hypothetical protein VFJ85_15195 [Acidimicrobiales bacterium]|nr:hypothetical protein [Acidimicrobiales bacterium]